MKKLKKYFGEYELSYKKIILFSIIAGVFTGLINSITLLRNTSFQDVAINFDIWILFAILIIVNSKTPKDAILKCFVFFLISQPLVYLVEVPFNPEGFMIFRYYKTWAIWTILTIPLSIIAYTLKRKNIFSMFVLSPIVVYLSYMACNYLKTTIYNFPYHLISSIFCILLSIFLSYILFNNKLYSRILVILFVITFIIFNYVNNKDTTKEIILDNANYTYEVETQNVVNVKENDNKLILSSIHDGYTYLYITDKNNKTTTYYITVHGGGILINEIDD